jgi:hypothetical protein
MTDLSPAAQAVMYAYNEVYESDLHAVAAALQAVADQIGPDGHDYSHGSIAELMWRGRREARRDLLAIAAELEGADG